MTALTANSSYYKSDEGSVDKNCQPDTPHQKATITGSTFSNNNTESNATANENSNSHPVNTPLNSSSASILNTNQSFDTDVLSEEESHSILESLQLIKDLDLFLVTAPVNWHENQVIRRYFLNKEEGFVSCVYWNNLYFITGTDIVRCIAYKMSHIGRQIIDRKKFEEGIFSDLRALKCGTHAVLENSRSPFLKFLHRNQCLRTQKKQKVFFWFSVPHNKLFIDVLERDLKRELSNQPATTKPVSKIFTSFNFDQSQPLLEQLSTHFSKVLDKDVSHLILKSNNIIPMSADLTNKEKNNASSVSTAADPLDKNNPNNHITVSNSTDNANNQISDDFPLDFLESNQILDENYIAMQSVGSAKAGSQFQNTMDDTFALKSNSNFYQPFPQQQPSSNNSQFMDHFEGLLLNNQPLYSASVYSQPQQPLFVLSDLPSAIEPTNVLQGVPNYGRNSPMSAGISQFFPISIPHGPMLTSPSTILMNGENQIALDQLMAQPNDSSNQSASYYSKMRRSSSPVVASNNGTSTYMNLPSATFLPVYQPVSNSNSFSGPATYTINPPTSHEDDNLDMGKHKNEKEDEDTNEPNTEENTDKKQQNNSNLKVEPNDSKQQINARQHDYMMLMPSYAGNSNRLNFGIVGGQFFTPSSIGMEYSFDNAALSAGVGISPVIGFNNGMLSAIQYQQPKSFDMKHGLSSQVGETTDGNDGEDGDQEGDDDDDDEEDDCDELDSENVEQNVETSTYDEKNKNNMLTDGSSKKLKGILLKDKNSKVTKRKNVKMRSKMKFLNPTLQHLQLDDVFDVNDDVHDDVGSQHKADVKKENS